MRRRTFLAGMLGVAAAKRSLAQKARAANVVLMTAPPLPNAFVEAFRAGMRDLGYLEGRNLQLRTLSVDGRPDRFPALARQAVEAQPDVIVAGGGVPSVRAAMSATGSIPIVFPASGDPVGEGLVRSLARPGGNVTGQSILTVELSAKRLQILRELLPSIRRIAVLQDPVLRTGIDQVGATERAARQLHIELQVVNAKGPEQYEAAFTAVKNAGAQALIVLPSSAFSANRARLIALAAAHRLPAVWEHRLFAHSGGLISYGTDIAAMYRSCARYVAKILDGAKPAELPVERASKLDLVINLSNARAIGLEVPATLLAQADEVIE